MLVFLMYLTTINITTTSSSSLETKISNLDKTISDTLKSSQELLNDLKEISDLLPDIENTTNKYIALKKAAEKHIIGISYKEKEVIRPLISKETIEEYLREREIRQQLKLYESIKTGCEKSDETLQANKGPKVLKPPFPTWPSIWKPDKYIGKSKTAAYYKRNALIKRILKKK